MDGQKICEALKSTMNPATREEAEKYLTEVQKIIGFVPTLLQLIMTDDLDPAVRQAGGIYLKNTITTYWDHFNEAAAAANPLAFKIHEQDRHVIRENIVEAVIHAPEPIRVQLSVCISVMIKYDFPGRWPQVADKISQYLQLNDGNSWMGALTVLYRLVKNFEFKKPKEKEPLNETMKVLLPICYEKMLVLMPDSSKESVYLQKLILKIFYALVQCSMNLTVMSKDQFSKWMELVQEVVQRPVPEETLAVEEEERPELIWWKCKKWAAALMARIFERYGQAGQYGSVYNQFADYYLKQFAKPSIHCMLKVLADYRNKVYVAPRVLHHALSYLEAGVGHAFSWKVIQPHFQEILQHVIFPLMSFTDADAELWTEDPQEFIRVKYDIFDDLVNPCSAAVSLLQSVMKRKGYLPKVVNYIVSILNTPDMDPKNIDGAMHMIGTIGPNLMKRKMYKNELETMIVTHVLPKFESEHAYIRSRACWCIQSFSETPFKNDTNLVRTTAYVIKSVLEEQELPVKMEGALAMQMLLADQPKVSKLLEPHIKQIVLAVLTLIKDTENDDLTTVMEKLITTFMDQIVPIAVEVAQGLANVFKTFLESDEGGMEDRAVAAMGVLNTLESVLNVMEEHPEIMERLEAIVLDVINTVITCSVMDFYEEVLSLVESLTCSRVSETMWQVFENLNEMFKLEGIEFFTDMMPALHNYVTVDTDSFLAKENRIQILFEMCKQVLTEEDIGDDCQCHAAKLLEVVILQCKGKVDGYIRPFTELVLARLTKEVHTSELRTMLLQVVIAGLYYNTKLMFDTLQSLQPPDSTQGILDHFVHQWLNDTDCFLGVHDRKLCVIGLCILMAERPVAIQGELGQQIIPSVLLVFDGLTKAYQAQAEMKNKEESDEEEEEEEDHDDGLASDEDEIDDTAAHYMEKMSKDVDSGNDDAFSDSDDDSDFYDETDLEIYETPLDGEDCPLDEYILFKETLIQLEQRQKEYFTFLTGKLSIEQTNELQKVFTLADQRRAAKESKAIEETGGYKFATDQVPSAFNFGGGAF